MKTTPVITISEKDLQDFNDFFAESGKKFNLDIPSVKFEFDEYQEIFQNLFQHYTKAAEHLKTNNLEAFLLELKKAGSKILTAVAEKIPTLEFIPFYSYLIRFLLTTAFNHYKNKFGDLRQTLSSENYISFLLLDQQVQHQQSMLFEIPLQTHELRYKQSVAVNRVLETEKDINLHVRYFLYIPLISHFLPADKISEETEILLTQRSQSEAKPISDMLKSFVEKTTPVDEIDPEIATRIVAKIKAELTTTATNLSNAKPSKLNLFVRSTAAKIAQINLLIKSIEDADKLSGIHAAFNTTYLNENMTHRNFFLRCASRLFPIPAPSTTKQLHQIEKMLPDFSALTTLIPS